MYSQNDLDDAVASGAITPEAATSLRAFVDQQRKSPAVDEEHFRLITGFNDIFVSIAAAILLFAVGFIGQQLGPQIEPDGPSPTIGLLVAGTAWGLAEFFTRKRRMALPSILLLLAFAGGVFATVGFGLGLFIDPDASPEGQQVVVAALIGATAAAVTAVATWFHWKRFRVPITVAAGTAAAVGIVAGILV